MIRCRVFYVFCDESVVLVYVLYSRFIVLIQTDFFNDLILQYLYISSSSLAQTSNIVLNQP